MVTFRYWIKAGSVKGTLNADNPEQVLKQLFPADGHHLRSDTHVDHVNWIKHMHYFITDPCGDIVGDFRGERPLNRRGR